MQRKSFSLGDNNNERRVLLNTYRVDKPRKPKTRSFTGCWPCRTRKVRCDMTRPICLKCKRQRTPCDYGLRLTWCQTMTLSKDPSKALRNDSNNEGLPNAMELITTTATQREPLLPDMLPIMGKSSHKRSKVGFVKWPQPYMSSEVIETCIAGLKLSPLKLSNNAQLVTGPFSVFKHKPSRKVPIDWSMKSIISNPETMNKSNSRLLQLYNLHTDFFGLNEQQRLDEEKKKKLGSTVKQHIKLPKVDTAQEQPLISEQQTETQNRYVIYFKKWLDQSLVDSFTLGYNFTKNANYSAVEMAERVRHDKKVLDYQFNGPYDDIESILARLQKLGFFQRGISDINEGVELEYSLFKSLVKNFTVNVVKKLCNYNISSFNFWEALIWRNELLPIVHDFTFDSDVYLGMLGKVVKNGTKGLDSSSYIILLKASLIFLVLSMSSFNLHRSSKQHKDLELSSCLSSLSSYIIRNILSAILDDDIYAITTPDERERKLKKLFTNLSKVQTLTALIKYLLLYVVIKTYFNTMVELCMAKIFNLGEFLIAFLQKANKTANKNSSFNYTHYNEDLYDEFLDQDLNNLNDKEILGEDCFYLIKILKISKIFYDATQIYDFHDFEVFKISKFEQAFRSSLVTNNIEQSPITDTDMTSSLFKTQIKILQDEEYDSHKNDGSKSRMLATKHLDFLNGTNMTKFNIPVALQKNFVDKVSHIYRSSEFVGYDINDDYELNDDEDPPPLTVQVLFNYGNMESLAEQRGQQKSDTKTLSAVSSDKLTSNHTGKKATLDLKKYTINNSDINCMLELLLGLPLSLIRLFQQIVSLTKHQLYFLVNSINLRLLPKVCADIEDSLLSWKIPWDLYIEEEEDQIDNHPKKKKFHSINHEILYHNVRSFYHALVIYYFTLVKDIPLTFLQLHLVKIYEHLNFLRYVLRPAKDTSSIKQFHTFRPSFFAFFMVGVEGKNTAFQQRLKELMDFYEGAWTEQAYLSRYWRGKQVVYEIWRAVREQQARSHEDELSWIDLVKDLKWEFSVM